MKKIFTLMAVAGLAAGASAQGIYKSTGESVAAGTVLVDNEDLTVKTVYASKGEAQEVTMFDETFTGWFQLRVNSDPTADNLTGDETEGSTPLIVEVKKDLTFTVYDRRQKGNDGYNAGDNKGILAINQDGATKVAGSIEFYAYDGEPDAYGLCAESFEFAPGTYTLYRRGSTMRIFGFKWDVAGDNVLASWDFTKWSDATVANLKAVNSNWSDDEKDNGTTVDGKCFWQVSASAGLSPEKYVEANGVVIEELKGLVYTNTKDRSLAIAVDYPSTSLGDYHGAQYLWFGGKNLEYFIIPGVPAGATIKMGVESHKTSEARGVKLTVAGEELKAPNGAAVEVPTTYEEQEWMVPATAAESNDVQITNTNGCHIYFITVTGEGSAVGVQTVATDENAPVEYYNLQGVRVANPENGLYIKRQGNKAVKVLVK